MREGTGPTPHEGTGPTKRDVRAAVRARRSSMTAHQRAEATQTLTAHLIALADGHGVRSLSCYAPRSDEPDTRPFLAWARQRGLRVLLPSARADGLLDWVRDVRNEHVMHDEHVMRDEPAGSNAPSAITSAVEAALARGSTAGDPTAVYRAGRFGIAEPPGERLAPSAVGDVDLMIIPACAVDRSGGRLGWGRGYFDRTLAQLDGRPPVYAVVFDDDVLDAVPSEPHDVPITGAVTPSGLLHPTRSTE